jgi:ABC-2 type transport system ATP-binding protein
VAVIEVRNLRKTYGDGTEAVKDVSFSVEKGEIFGFLGPNGAGKTTTMRILGTLQRQTSGGARVLDLDVATEARKLKRRIGFAMQEIGMDDLATGREMLILHGRLYGLAAREAATRAERLLKVFDLEGHADRRVVNFSGGMQRRLDLAVSIIHSPEVLFLDEPSTGLDPTSRSTLWAILRRLRKDEGLTILMSTHYMEEADALCDRIAVIHQGRIAAIDTPGNLKRSIGSDTLRIAVGSPLDQAQKKGLAEAFGAANVSMQDGTLDLRVKDGARALMPALQKVSSLGLQVRETKVLTPTLEDVFLRYTGAKFEAAHAAGKADDPHGQAHGHAPAKAGGAA